MGHTRWRRAHLLKHSGAGARILSPSLHTIPANDTTLFLRVETALSKNCQLVSVISRTIGACHLFCLDEFDRPGTTPALDIKPQQPISTSAPELETLTVVWRYGKSYISILA